MSRDWAAAFLLIALLLLVGMGIGRGLRPDAVQSADEIAVTEFRAWFWEHQTFDLLAQICLIFAGALGVAAVLPPRVLPRTGEPSGESEEGF